MSSQGRGIEEGEPFQLSSIHIHHDEELLSDPTISPQSRRHTEEELESLKLYKEHHPGEDHDPNSLELYCDTHPDSVECRVYED